jgi:ABC-type transport system involved in multi-copper enzyme maturation permease subunit
MRQFVTIAVNAFMELIRQPVFLLLLTTSGVFCVFLATVPYFGFGDDPKLVKDSVLAVTLLAGLLGAVLSASSSLAREIRTGTALAVLSKPVSRAQFLLAKYAGLAAALTILTYVNVLACLLASRMGYDAYGDADVAGLGIWCGGFLLAYVAGGFSNFFLRRPFTSDAVLAVVAFATLAFLLNAAMSKADPTSRNITIGAFEKVDWRLVPAGVLILFALWILAGLALLCSTRLELIATLSVCSAFFLVGLMSDYFYQKLGGTEQGGGPWYAVALYSVLPNWQQLWMADALEEGKTIPLRYVGTAFGYVVAYVGASLAVALCLFEDRELT